MLAAPHVRSLLRDGRVGIATVNLAEALDVTERVYGVPTERTLEAITPLLAGTRDTLALDVRTAQRAAQLRAHHYHRSRSPLSLADAVLLASAAPGVRLATSDPDVLAVESSEKIGVLPLPGQASAGL